MKLIKASNRDALTMVSQSRTSSFFYSYFSLSILSNTCNSVEPDINSLTYDPANPTYDPANPTYDPKFIPIIGTAHKFCLSSFYLKWPRSTD